MAQVRASTLRSSAATEDVRQPVAGCRALDSLSCGHVGLTQAHVALRTLARDVIGDLVERYDSGWLLQQHGYLTPARDKVSRWASLMPETVISWPRSRDH